MKRVFDILFSLLALALLSPLLLGSAIAVFVESGRPVFFRQVRVGMEGREFGMLKFRSMVQNAAVLGTYQTAVNDPRVTRVGRFLRRTSLDELPQLLNVLKGEMSVVGPGRMFLSSGRAIRLRSGRSGTGCGQASQAWRRFCTDPTR